MRNYSVTIDLLYQKLSWSFKNYAPVVKSSDFAFKKLDFSKKKKKKKKRRQKKNPLVFIQENYNPPINLIFFSFL